MGGRGTVAPVGVADGLTRTMEGGKSLNDGQWDAVCGLLDSRTGSTWSRARPVPGKSSLLGKYDEGMRRAGRDR